MTKSKTKKGAASIYAVVFITLLLGIIAVSFVRLILRESTSTINSELSSSSRDAALAGVEDAKRAVDQYLKTTGPKASFYKADGTTLNCDFVRQMLTSSTETEKETVISTQSTTEGETQQAYTCVTVDPYSPDYKGTLDNANSVIVIPLQYDPTKNKPKFVTFSWQKISGSEEPKLVNKDYYKKKGEQSTTETNKVVPPVISLQYVQSETAMDPIGKYAYTANPASTGLLFLTPAFHASGATNVGDIIKKRDDSDNNPTKVNCYETLGATSGANNDGYMCAARFSIPDTSASQYLVISLPYQTGATDFRVSMADASGNTVNFFGVQYVVDSTGRANDLYTRLEVRLNSVNPEFPYPQFALQSEGGIEKHFWVTNNCYTVNYLGDGTGEAARCDDSGNL